MSILREDIFFVVNINVLFFFFGKLIVIREFVFLVLGRFISFEFVLEEFYEYRDEVLKKVKIGEKEFEEILFVFKEYVIFVNEGFYVEFIFLVFE